MKHRTAIVLGLVLAAALLYAFIGVWPPVGPSPEPRKEAKILFVGDIMLDRTIRKIGEEKGYDHIFSCAKDYLSGFDLVVGNLEGPVTLHGSVSLSTKPGEPGNTTFTFSPEAIAALARANVKLLNLGNNHILDFGPEGVESTEAFLSRNGVGYFGAPGSDKAAIRDLGGLKVAFVSFNQFLGQGDARKTVDAITKVSAESDLVAVYAHWGDEYEAATEYQKALARRFIDAGAFLVVGSHPHVIQERESYGKGEIHYSLGNFIFDQYWVPEVRTGAGLEMHLSQKGVSFSERMFDIERGGLTCLR